MHICEDMFIPGIIDALIPGKYCRKARFGELVFSTITKEGQPLLRYRTRDLCMLDYTPCKCGRTHVRMKKPAGKNG